MKIDDLQALVREAADPPFCVDADEFGVDVVQTLDDVDQIVVARMRDRFTARAWTALANHAESLLDLYAAAGDLVRWRDSDERTGALLDAVLDRIAATCTRLGEIP